MISDNNAIRELQRENKMLMQQNDLENALNDVFRKEIARLKDENSKLKEHIKSLDVIILKLKDENTEDWSDTE